MQRVIDSGDVTRRRHHDGTAFYTLAGVRVQTRALKLSCGHTLTRKVSIPVPKHVACGHCSA